MKSTTILRHVLQRDGRLKLVMVLLAIRIVFILENSGEFVGVALELDGHSHLATRAPPGHILFAPTDPACWRRGTNLVEKLLGLVLETETPAPALVPLFLEHPMPLRPNTTEAHFKNRK